MTSSATPLSPPRANIGKLYCCAIADSMSRSVMRFSCTAASPNRTPCALAKRWISSTSWEFRRPCSMSMVPIARPRSGGVICRLTGRSTRLFISNYRRFEAPGRCLRKAHVTGTYAHDIELAEQRDTEQIDDVFIFAHASIAHFGGQSGGDSQHSSQKDRDNQIDHELGTGRAAGRGGGAQLNDIGLLRQTFQIALRQPLTHLIQIALRRRHVAFEHGRLVMLILELQHLLLLSLEGLAHIVFAA